MPGRDNCGGTGVVTLNGVIVTEKRKKVFPQDTVVLDQQVEIKVITE